jgi:hypothetical protein
LCLGNRLARSPPLPWCCTSASLLAGGYREGLVGCTAAALSKQRYSRTPRSSSR